MKKIYCTSLNGEDFNGADYETQEEAVAEMNRDYPEMNEFYVGVAKPMTQGDVASCCYLDPDMVRDQMMNEVGEVAEEWLSDIEDKEWDELAGIIGEWIWKKDKPTFFRVEEIEKFNIKK
jgi:hypothetical protein